MQRHMKRQEKQKNRLIYLLLMLCILLLGLICLGVIKQQKEMKESSVIAAKQEPRHADAPLNDIHIHEPLAAISCQKDGNVDDGLVAVANQQLSLLPAYIQDAFVHEGWGVYVTDMNIGQTYYAGKYDQVMATTNYEEQRILIESRLDAVYESPIHEVGHWFDYYVGLVSYENAFTEIYNSESAAFIHAYGSECVRDAQELFAEGFWQYIVDPGRLKSTCPSLYLYIRLSYCYLRVLRTWYEYGL